MTGPDPEKRKARKKRAKATATARQAEVPSKVLAIAERIAYADKHADKPLTEQQRKFVENVAVHGMAPKQACVALGIRHAQSTASHYTKSLAVQRAIQKIREEQEKAGLMTKKRVMDGFLEAIDMARTLADPVAMTGGWREIAKMCGYYEPTRHKLEVSVDGQVVIQKLQQLNDEDLLKLADGKTDALEGEFQVIQRD